MMSLRFFVLIFGVSAFAFAEDFSNPKAPDGFKEQRFFNDIVDYGEEYLSPEYLAADADANTLLVACKTGDKVIVIVNGSKAGEIPLGGRASGVCVAPDGIAYATSLGEFGKLHKLSYKKDFKILESWNAGHFPTVPLASSDGKFVYIANQFTNTIQKFDAASGKVLARGKADHEPLAMKLSPDGKELIIANNLPAPKGGLYEENIGCVASILNADNLENISTISLPNGAINCKDLTVSADGKYCYLSYVFARFNVPTSQLDGGWINTNAVAVIDLPNKKWITSFLLDENTLGAANPWGIALSPNGKTLAVASAGTHEVSLINVEELHKKIEAPRKDREPPIVDDLNFLSGIRTRVPLSGLGPRGLVWIKDLVCVAQYYSDDLALVDTKKDNLVHAINIGGNKKMTQARLGDLYFNDARMCFQQWLSCGTCHPSTRSDNLNWDLMNDGIGNPKQSKSMLFAPYTPPAMITGIREAVEVCVRAGILYIQFTERPEEDAVCIDEFLKRLQAIPSPYAPAGVLSESAENGKVFFDAAGCSNCHTGKYFTDMKLHNLDTAVGPDEGKPFDTPPLREVWRSAPYLYDGRAKSIFDMLKNFNENQRHGKTKELSDEDLKDLEQYVLTL